MSISGNEYKVDSDEGRTTNAALITARKRRNEKGKLETNNEPEGGCSGPFCIQGVFYEFFK